MEELLRYKYFTPKIDQKNQDDQISNILNSNIPRKPSNSFETSLQKSENIINNPLSNTLPQTTFEKYKNQQLLNSIQSNIIPCSCGCVSGSSYLCKNYHHCHNHHIILSPHHHHIIKTIIPIQNNNNTNFIKENNKTINTDLLTEVTELRNECKKIKEELTRNRNINLAGSEYIKKLENEINIKKIQVGKLQEKDDENNLLRYHEMLGKSFEVLNCVSNKTNDEKAKTKGGMNYYINKDQDYNELIDAQKKWVDEIPDRYLSSERESLHNNNNINNLNNILNKNQNFIDESLNDLCKKYLPNNNIPPTNNYISNNKYDPNRNNNKVLRTSKEEKNDFDTTSNTNNYKNNLNDISPKLNLLNNSNNLNADISNINNNINNNNNINTQNTNNDEDSGINSIISKNPNENAPDIPNDNEINNKDNNQMNEIDNNQINESESPIQIFNERFLIIDEQGNPIKTNGEKLLGMELIPLLDENGQEILDDNGNIVIIGPDGEPKTQDELEPVLLDNDIPLVNEENKPFLGINGIPIINGYGSPILGPGELYDKNNKVVNGIIGTIPKDNNGNPIKINLNDLNNDNSENPNSMNNNADEKENNDDGNDNENNLENNDVGNNDNINKNIFDKYKPLIGKDGKPIFDQDNNPIILDENNAPIIDSGINLLLDKNGKPVLNAKGKPVLIDSEGRPIDENYNIIRMPNKNNNNNNIIPENIPPRNPKKTKKGSQKKLKKKKSVKGLNKKRPSSKKNNVISNNPRNHRMKGDSIYFDDINSNSKKMKYGPGDDSFYSNRKNCFACDVGCNISSTGYSPMTYSPYDNRIKRRNVTPTENNEYYQYSNRRSNKVALGGEKDNNYYIVEAEN